MSINTLVRFAAAFAVFAFLLGAAEQKKLSNADAVIAGSVFRDPGYALPDATVTLVRKDDPKHKKLAQQSTTYRGEFVFHVPTAEAVYVVKASAKGYRPEEKEASVSGPDRVDLTFTLEPEPKK
ncbi:MAG TPA: carboxypeptidase-like regulatory domain-containing protein [Bryobacteraceae bacterium]|nr:carboxypeptidase-like regulatory domain-containing protein [Bryobacteraceae bacterium]